MHAASNHAWIVSMGLVLAVAPTAALADLVQPPAPSGGQSFTSELWGPQRADDWTATSSAGLVGVEFWGSYLGDAVPSDDAFVITMREDDGGSPGDVIWELSSFTYSMREATELVDDVGRAVSRYYLGVDWVIWWGSPGTAYWLTIVNDATQHGGGTWHWYEGTPGDGLHALRASSGAEWQSATADLAFNLYYFPGPAALSALGAGLLMGQTRTRQRSI